MFIGDLCTEEKFCPFPAQRQMVCPETDSPWPIHSPAVWDAENHSVVLVSLAQSKRNMQPQCLTLKVQSTATLSPRQILRQPGRLKI